MRRFIILSILGLGACLGTSATTQAAVVKRITTTKVTVQKQVVIEHVGPRRVGPVHDGRFVAMHWDYHHFRG